MIIFTKLVKGEQQTINRLSGRDVMHKRGLCCSPVSVRLSVTFVYFIQAAEDIKNFFLGPVALSF